LSLDDFQVWKGKQAWATELTNEAHKLDSYLPPTTHTKVTIKKGKARRFGELTLKYNIYFSDLNRPNQFLIVCFSPVAFRL